MTIEFYVPGKPEPGGSKKGFIVQRKGTPGTSRKDFQAVLVDANKEKVQPWKEKVAACARINYQGPPLHGPIQMEVTFTLLRPQSHMGTGRNEGVVKASANEHPIIKPDALKLTRAVEDALTGIAYHDDAQIVAEHIFKVYGPREGARVTIAPYVESLF